MTRKLMIEYVTSKRNRQVWIGKQELGNWKFSSGKKISIRTFVEEVWRMDVELTEASLIFGVSVTFDGNFVENWLKKKKIDEQ